MIVWEFLIYKIKIETILVSNPLHRLQFLTIIFPTNIHNLIFSIENLQQLILFSIFVASKFKSNLIKNLKKKKIFPSNFFCVKDFQNNPLVLKNKISDFNRNLKTKNSPSQAKLRSDLLNVIWVLEIAQVWNCSDDISVVCNDLLFTW